MPELWLRNLVAHWLQAGFLVIGAAAVVALLRVRHSRVRLLFWQIVLALCVLLPLVQSRRLQPAVDAAASAAASGDAVVMSASAESLVVAQWPAMILLAVAAGILFRLAWIAMGLIRLHQLRTSLERDAGDVAEIRAVLTEVGVRASIQMSGCQGPLSFGALRPVVLLPASCLTLDSESRRAVILHELIHVRRRDWLTALVEELILAFLWFHPWSWWVRAQIRLAREETVDREVMSRLRAPGVYATCLLSMAGYDAAAFPSTVALLRARELRQRLDALFQEVSMSRLRFAATSTLLGVVLSGFIAAAVTAFPLLQNAARESPGGSSRRVVQLVPPEYPAPARDGGLSGIVTVEVTVNAAGDVSGFNVVSGPSELRDSAVSALRQWRFEKARTADVLIVELGYQPNIRKGQRVPGWSFVIWDKAAADRVLAESLEFGTPLRVGGDVKPPKKIKDVRPIYPSDARATQVQGIVIIEATIGAEGKVTDTKVLRSIPALDQAAIDAVRQWEFVPVLLNGHPTPVIMVITVQFSLQ